MNADKFVIMFCLLSNIILLLSYNSLTYFMNRIYTTIIAFMLLSGTTLAQENTPYQTPAPELASLVTAAPTPSVSVDGKGEWLIILERAAHPTIAELSQPELRLAGIRINPANNGPARPLYVREIRFKNLQTEQEHSLSGIPAEANISHISWAPDYSKIAFTVSTDDGIYLYVAETATGLAKQVIQESLNATMGTPYHWLSDSQTLLARIVPLNRGAAPQPNRVPTGPVIQENLGKKSIAPTFQDLLKNREDEALFDYYFTSQLVKVSLGGEVEKIGKPGIIATSQPSPDARYILFQTIDRPYSYLVPASLFPLKTEILTLAGEPVKTLFERPLVENVPWGRDAVPPGSRYFGWRSDAPASVYWVETRDDGDAKKEAPIRDQVFLLNAPFEQEPKLIFSAKLRFGRITWGNDQIALVNERWWDSRKTITHIINPSQPGTSKVLFDLSSEDRYNDPGTPQLKRNQFGAYVLNLTPKNEVFLFGQGASPEGDRPFVDQLNLNTQKTERIWRSEAPVYEVPVALLDISKPSVLTTRETPDEVPNFYVRQLKPGKRENPLRQVTAFPHPLPHLKGIQKQVLRYKREDGVELTANLYLPVGYKKENGPLPTLLWAYPREYKDREAAGQMQGSPYQFNRISYWGAAAFVTRGYAILDNAAMPIVGEGDAEPNDTYVKQLVASAKAAIDEGVRLGVVDPNRVGVGGHSYGAFMTANLLTHSDLFKAGIARSGAYNRTLTPFGFQNEQRTYWQAPEVYNTMSPFMNADKVKTPILLIHGEADNNTGTFPMQSERYYTALKSMGATVRLVVLPHESHGYTAQESLLHMLWEMDRWLETYVKGAK